MKKQNQLLKSIDDLTLSLNNLKDLNLETPNGVKDEDLISAHLKIKETMKLTSEFQTMLSPIQKGINRKRIDYLKKSGRKSKELTKNELLQEVVRLKKLLDTSTTKE